MSGGIQIAAITSVLAAAVGVALLLWALFVVARWRMFAKADEKGWKSLIPIYSDYTLFKLVWSVKSFWFYMGFILITILATVFSCQYAVVDGQLMLVSVGNVFVGAISFVVLFYTMMLAIKTAQAYGKGAVHAIGLFLLPNVFALIIAFGSAKYIGPQ